MKPVRLNGGGPVAVTPTCGGRPMTQPRPIESPAAWRGEQLLRRSDWCHVLNRGELDDLQRAIQDAERSAGRQGASTGQAETLLTLGGFGETIRGIQRDLEERSGATLVKGLPVDGVSEDALRQLFWTVASHLGTPLSQSAAGERVFSVRDEGFRVGQRQARGPNTRKRLNYHTDRCDVIAFLCLKQASSGGENRLVSSVALYNEMLRTRPDLVEALMQPVYYLRHNVDTGNAQTWCQQPIFSFCDGHFACSYLRVLIDRAYASPELPDMPADLREAMDYLDQLADQPEMHVAFYLEPGDMLFLNNWVTLHRRTEFQDHEDPSQRRHLLRIWLAVPNSRPLDPKFAANFGATAAGAVRGGMRPASEH